MILQLYFRDEKHARGSHGSHLFILGEDLEAKTSLLLVSLGFSWVSSYPRPITEQHEG
jgi:hypothetical protein